ncbi:MAG: phosphohydrolase [Chloroflexi bacterium]|nr:MAG: phosphohydrolase [Chloroflexota bacterium]
MSDAQLFDAIEFAARAHHGQFRKASPLPYIIHPLNVTRILIEWGAETEIVIAGVLHDVVEDTSVTLPEIRAQFGERVAALVQGMSEPNRQDAWETRKRAMLAAMETAPQDILLIELADRLDNIREIQKDLAREGEAVWARFNRGRERQQWLYEQYVDLFNRRMENARALTAEFERCVRAVFGAVET